MFSQKIKWPLAWQLVHALACVIWNVAGLVLVSLGSAPLGPVASWIVVMAATLMAGLLWLGAKRFIWLYFLISILQLLLSLNAVSTPFIKDPALWVYSGSRFAGLAINVVGLLGSAWGIAIWCRLKGWTLKL